MEQEKEPSTTILDPSDKFRPEKEEELFRNFTNNCTYHGRVRNIYYQMHSVQSLAYAEERMSHWHQFNHAEMTILEALDTLNNLVDESDPDVDIPNSVHAYQTAERIRQKHPDKQWFHLTGLIHDIGKIMAMYGEPQYSVVGDTFAVGCDYADSIVFGQESFINNPDYTNPVYRTKTGIYEENCGLDKVTMSWGHDEYLYRVLRAHKNCSLPEEALYIIRFHSFYPWHTGNDYMHLCSNKDLEMLDWIREFNKFDLYSKADAVPDVEALKPYYQSLVDKFCPGKIWF